MTTRPRQEEAADLRRALDTAEAALAQVRAELTASEQAREDLEQRRAATRLCVPAVHDQEGVPTRRGVGRPLGSIKRVLDQEPGNKPEPVKWWAGD